jgi:hypothetical protein
MRQGPRPRGLPLGDEGRCLPHPAASILARQPLAVICRQVLGQEINRLGNGVKPVRALLHPDFIEQFSDDDLTGGEQKLLHPDDE